MNLREQYIILSGHDIIEEDEDKDLVHFCNLIAKFVLGQNPNMSEIRNYSIYSMLDHLHSYKMGVLDKVDEDIEVKLTIDLKKVIEHNINSLL